MVVIVASLIAFQNPISMQNAIGECRATWEPCREGRGGQGRGRTQEGER